MSDECPIPQGRICDASSKRDVVKAFKVRLELPETSCVTQFNRRPDEGGFQWAVRIGRIVQHDNYLGCRVDLGLRVVGLNFDQVGNVLGPGRNGCQKQPSDANKERSHDCPGPVAKPHEHIVTNRNAGWQGRTSHRLERADGPSQHDSSRTYRRISSGVGLPGSLFLALGTLRLERLREEVIRVATAAKPTNVHIVEMLTQVLRELGEVRKTQDQLAGDVCRVAQQSLK